MFPIPPISKSYLAAASTCLIPSFNWALFGSSSNPFL
jgi:hypothetical protein